jgi:hypothetical protein
MAAVVFIGRDRFGLGRVEFSQVVRWFGTVFCAIGHWHENRALNDNPFDTAIRFRAAICSARLFELDIQTADGRSVDGLCADSLVVGAYEVEWTPHDLPSGFTISIFATAANIK